jgi:hypothetical protein
MASKAIGWSLTYHRNCCILVSRVRGNPVFSDVRFAAPNFWLFVQPENQNLAATRAIGKDRFQPK